MTDTISPYLAARQKLARALEAEQQARETWTELNGGSGTPASTAQIAAWDRYTQAGLAVVAAETELEDRFGGELLASAARSQFYARFVDLSTSKEDAENLTVAGFLGPQEAPNRREWVEFCMRAEIDPEFDPGAEFLQS